MPVTPKAISSRSARVRPNKSFKPNLLRYTKHMAEKACHVFGSTTQVGLTQALCVSGYSYCYRYLQAGAQILLLFCALVILCRSSYFLCLRRGRRSIEQRSERLTQHKFIRENQKSEGKRKRE